MKENKFNIAFAITLLIVLLAPIKSFGQWVDLGKVTTSKSSEKDVHSTIKFNIDKSVVSEESPVYIFVRYRVSKDGEWKLLSEDDTKGEGIDIVTASGSKAINVPFSDELTSKNAGKAEFIVRGIAVKEVPAGEFVLMSIPGSGYNKSMLEGGPRNLATYYMATYETTNSMYTDFLNETAKKGGDAWKEAMADENTCGIVREGSQPNFNYKVLKGRENYPVTSATWFSAKDFLAWCGMRLPTEEEWEKATIGGKYLDGDVAKKKLNPIPNRTYPWGNEDIETDNGVKANIDGDADGYEFTAPVGSFPEDVSPYGIYDLGGNVAEWTLDFYTNRFLGKNGYRVLRGGSWIAFPEGVDAVSQATSQPLQGSAMIGFRGVMGEPIKQ